MKIRTKYYKKNQDLDYYQIHGIIKSLHWRISHLLLINLGQNNEKWSVWEVICVGTSHKALGYITCLSQISKLCTSYIYVAYLNLTYSYTYIVFTGHESYCISSLIHRYMLLSHDFNIHRQSFPNYILWGVVSLPCKLISLCYFFLNMFQNVFNSSVSSATQLS